MRPDLATIPQPWLGGIGSGCLCECHSTAIRIPRLQVFDRVGQVIPFRSVWPGILSSVAAMILRIFRPVPDAFPAQSTVKPILPGDITAGFRFTDDSADVFETYAGMHGMRAKDARSSGCRAHRNIREAG